MLLPVEPGLEQFRQAEARIRGYVRRTPMLHAVALKQPPAGADNLYLKLELVQVTGSFKPRGAINKLLTLPADDLKRGLVTASGGNHGLAVAYAGWVAGVPATVYLPGNTPKAKAEKLERWGARVVFEGAVWDEANRAAQVVAERDGLTYMHPFADPVIIAGQGTIGLEILEDLPDADVILVAIGGGGLISGIAAAAKALCPAIRVIGVEPEGAATLHESLRAGRLVELPAIRTAASSLAARQTAPLNLDMVRRHVERVVLVSDDDLRHAARWLWFELGLAVEIAGAATAAALLTGKVQVLPGERVCALVCGAGSDGVS